MTSLPRRLRALRDEPVKPPKTDLAGASLLQANERRRHAGLLALSLVVVLLLAFAIL